MASTRLATYLYGTLASDRDPVRVVDVGCSYSGVGSEWNVFGPALHGVGFDPLEPEIERLRSTESRQNVTYEAAFVGLNETQKAERAAYEATLPPLLRYSPNPLARSSAIRAAQLKKFDHVKEFYNAGVDPKYSDWHIAIDEYVAETGAAPHVLKIDTDGADMEVLIGADGTLRSSVLAVLIECTFQGALNHYANTFAAIDSFLRERGFSLFTMEPFRYSRAALPGPFTCDMFGITKTGQLVWADALFLRDLAAPGYEATFKFEATAERIIATVCIMEVFGLQDCAAELIQTFAERLPYNEGTLLECLVPSYLGPCRSYADYVSRFNASPESLFASAQSVLPPNSIVGFSIMPLDLGAHLCDPLWGATAEASSEGLSVHTSGQPWAYAALLQFPVREGRGLIEIDIEVLEGRIGLAVLGPGLSEIISEAFIATGPIRLVILPIDDLANVLGVVLRNGRVDGAPSVALIKAARVATL